MRKILLSLLTLVAGITAQAANIIGGDLRYEYTGSAYKVELSLYTTCDFPLNIASNYVTISSSCAASSSLALTQYATDTLFDMYCPSTAAGCASNAYYLIYRYSGTIASLAPCSDWKLSYSYGSRPATVNNLNNAQNYNLYLEAFLNNSAAPNSSPVIGTDPDFVIVSNAFVTTPFQTLDIEGDSISGAFYQPLSAAGTSVPYAAGFSLNSPMSGPALLDIPGGTLRVRAAFTGRCALAVRVSDYRNGVLVGYSSRDWNTSIGVGNDHKVPLPIPGSSFLANACPGGATTATFHFADSLSTDSVYLAVKPQNTFSYATTYTNGTGLTGSTATTTWTTPSSLNPATTPYYFLKVRARDNNCPMQEFNTYTLLVRTAPCVADSVWPGDANADKIVNLYDPLYVALAYGKTGAARTGATTLWNAQVCAPWALNFNTGINMKHADCDGNGTVDNTDLAAITANYGMVHPRGSGETQYRGTGVPDLYFDHTGITATPGSTVTIPIKLGNATQSMNNILGLATHIVVSNITPTNMSIAYPSSWIGTAANTVRFSKSTSSNSIDWAYARNNQQNASGQGQIGAITFTVPMGTANQNVVLSMQNVKMIDATGATITGYNVLNDTLHISPTGVGSVNTPAFQAMIVPNPSFGNATLSLSMQYAGTLQVLVTDIAGRKVWTSNNTFAAGSQSIALPTNLPNGMYMVHVSDGTGSNVVKWLKAD